MAWYNPWYASFLHGGELSDYKDSVRAQAEAERRERMTPDERRRQERIDTQQYHERQRVLDAMSEDSRRAQKERNARLDAALAERLEAARARWEAQDAKDRAAREAAEAAYAAEQAKKRDSARSTLDRLWAEREAAITQVFDERQRQWKARALDPYVVERVRAQVVQMLGQPACVAVECAVYRHFVDGVCLPDAVRWARRHIAEWLEPVPMSEEERDARAILQLPPPPPPV